MVWVVSQSCGHRRRYIWINATFVRQSWDEHKGVFEFAGDFHYTIEQSDHMFTSNTFYRRNCQPKWMGERVCICRVFGQRLCACRVKFCGNKMNFRPLRARLYAALTNECEQSKLIDWKRATTKLIIVYVLSVTLGLVRCNHNSPHITMTMTTWCIFCSVSSDADQH